VVQYKFNAEIQGQVENSSQ